MYQNKAPCHQDSFGAIFTFDVSQDARIFPGSIMFGCFWNNCYVALMFYMSEL